MYEVSVFGAHQSDTTLATSWYISSVDEAFYHSSAVVTYIATVMALHVAVHGRRHILHLQLILVRCFVQARKMRSAHASGPEGRDLRTDTETLSSSLHPMVSGGRGCGCCR